MKYKQMLLSGLILLFASNVNAATSSQPTVDNNNDVLFFMLGGGPTVPPPGTGMITTTVTAHLKAGFGYSCGKFSFYNNIADMINNVTQQVRQLPFALQGAVTAAVTALPGYLMEQINPGLLKEIDQALDQSKELFRFSYKSCEQMESEMRKNGKGYNPYNGFMKAVVYNKWNLAAKNGTNIADVPKQITQNPAGPIKWLGGKDYGTPMNPIEINRDMVIAGYNIMLGRNADVSINTAPTGAMAKQPIVKIWPKPSDAGVWLQRIVGDKVIITSVAKAKPISINGHGLTQVVADLQPQIRSALNKAINTFDFTDINKFDGINMSAGIINALRDMPLAQRSVYMNRLVSEMAVNVTLDRVDLIRQMLSLGLNNPDNVTAKISGVTEKYIRSTTLPDLKLRLNEIFEAQTLKHTTINTTSIMLLNQDAALRSSGAYATQGQGDKPKIPTMIDGGVR